MVSRSNTPSRARAQIATSDLTTTPRTTSANRFLGDPHPPPPPPPPPGKDCPDKRRQIETRTHLRPYESQTDFVHRMQVSLQLFILLLRCQDSRTWTSGVPSEVARLFDWLEDIHVLHTLILSSLETTRDAQYPIVHRVTQSIHPFVL